MLPRPYLCRFGRRTGRDSRMWPNVSAPASPHLAEVVEVFCLRPWHKQLAVTLQLLLRKRETAIVLAIFHQAIFNKIFRVDLNEVTSDADTRELHFRVRKIRVA